MSVGAEDSPRRRHPLEHSPPGAVRTDPSPSGPPVSPLSPATNGRVHPEAEPAARVTGPVHPAETDAAPQQPADETHQAEHDEPEPTKHDHHVLIEPEEDRWAWRRKIRRNPRQLAVYRVAVAVAGLLMIALGCITGPLPGPGGIPLVLLGLAIWASEFEWAHKVMLWFKAQLHRYRGWPTRYQLLFWVIFAAVCGTLGYLYLLVMGVPFWAPTFVADLLHRLPGV